MRKLSREEKAARVRSLSFKRSRVLIASWSNENKRRVMNAERALRFYLTGEHNPAIAVRTLLSDLRHYSDAYKVNFAQQNDVADRDYAGQALELI